MPGLIFLLILLNCSIGEAESIASYWHALKKSADSCFAGIDMELKFEVGAIEKDIFDESESDQFGKLVFSVPLLSKQNRIQRNNAKIKFVERGAEIIGEIEKAEKLIKQKRRYLGLLKKMGGEDGLEILEKAMSIQEEIIGHESKRNAGIRKLEGYLKCSESLE